MRDTSHAFVCLPKTHREHRPRYHRACQVQPPTLMCVHCGSTVLMRAFACVRVGFGSGEYSCRALQPSSMVRHSSSSVYGASPSSVSSSRQPFGGYNHRIRNTQRARKRRALH
jgi:hypothetical protein